jgi:hypothetical protein
MVAFAAAAAAVVVIVVFRPLNHNILFSGVQTST